MFVIYQTVETLNIYKWKETLKLPLSIGIFIRGFILDLYFNKHEFLNLGPPYCHEDGAACSLPIFLERQVHRTHQSENRGLQANCLSQLRRCTMIIIEQMRYSKICISCLPIHAPYYAITQTHWGREGSKLCEQQKKLWWRCFQMQRMWLLLR